VSLVCGPLVALGNAVSWKSVDSYTAKGDGQFRYIRLWSIIPAPLRELRQLPFALTRA